MSGVVQLVERLGNLTIAYVDDAGRVTRRRGQSASLPYARTTTVGLVFDTSRTHLFDGDGRIM